MCIEFDSLRIQSYSRTMNRVQELIGLADIWDADLQREPRVRALALDHRLGLLECLLEAAKVGASKLRFRKAAGLLKIKQGQLAALKAEAAAFVPAVDVVVLDDDWGKKGRGAKIIAWIREHGATAAEVAERFQLALSTSRTYVRRAKSAQTLRKAA